jgi:hypothetical protein
MISLRQAVGEGPAAGACPDHTLEPCMRRTVPGVRCRSLVMRPDRTRQPHHRDDRDAGPFAPSRRRRDLNSPEFQDVFFRLGPDDLKQVVSAAVDCVSSTGMRYTAIQAFSGKRSNI